MFPDSVHAFLGIPTPRVPVGEAVFPVLTSTLTVGTPAEQAEQAETTGAFSADVLSPSRIQASYFYSREDRSRFAGMDAALRMNLSEGLMDGLDNQILSGTNGLLTGTNLANHNVTAETTYPLYISQLAYSRVDGRYASGVGDLRMVVGGETYAHAAGLYRGNSADQHALARLISDTGGVRVSAHVPVAASNRQNVVVRLGMRQDAVCAIVGGSEHYSRRGDRSKNRLDLDHGGYASRDQDSPDGWILQAASPDSLAMPNLLLSGPAGSGKSQEARRVLEASTEPMVAADFQTLLAALTLLERGARRALSTTSGVSSLLAASTHRVRSDRRSSGRLRNAALMW